MKRLIWMAAALAMLAGCGREFEPYWKILDFRVLAVRSSHPELRPGQTAEIDALTYTNLDQPISYRWEWCPFRTSARDKFECPLTAEELTEALQAGAAQNGGTPPNLPPLSFDLGTSDKAYFPYPANQQILRQYCESIQAFAAEAPEEIAAAVPVVDCERGLDVSLRLVATSGDKEIVTGKRINLWLGAEAVNQNPKLVDMQIRPATREAATYLQAQGIEWVQDPALDDGLWWVSMVRNTPLDIHAGVPFEVRALVDEITVDIWTPPAPQGADVDYLPPEQEVIVYRWMTTAGAYDPSERIYKNGLNTLEQASVTPFEIGQKGDSGDYDDDGIPNSSDACPQVAADGDKAEDDCTVTLWNIVRDGRLGADWISANLNVTGVRK